MRKAAGLQKAPAVFSFPGDKTPLDNNLPF